MSSQVVVPGLSSVDQGLAALRAGLPVLVLDDVDRENEGDVVLAAQTITPRWTGWTIRHSSGYLCAPMPADWADRLGLPPMVEQNEDALRTAYAITVDVAEGVTTGISATDRCRTVAALGDPSTVATDLLRKNLEPAVTPQAGRGGEVRRRNRTPVREVTDRSGCDETRSVRPSD